MTLKTRLDGCARKGALSTADLARWFAVPYHAIYQWRHGTTPQQYRQAQVEERLRWLEKAIAQNKKLPIPLSVRASDRSDYLLRIRRVYEHRRLP